MADPRWIPLAGVAALVLVVPALVCVGLGEDDDGRPRPPPSMLDLPETSMVPERFDEPIGGAAPTMAEEAPPPDGTRVIVGTVRDERGQPLAGIEVTGGSRYDLTDERGRFLLNGQPAAEVEISAEAPGYLTTVEVVPDGLDGEEAEATIVLDPGEAPAGLVVDPDGRGADRATVACADGPSVDTDREGRFVMPLDAEGCLAVATHDDHGASEPTTLEAGPSNRLALQTPGSIAGTVVDGEGRAIRTFVVRVVEFVDGDGQRRPHRYRQTFRNPRGRFTLSRLDRGTYTLAIEVGRQAVETEPIEVRPGGQPPGIRVVLP